MSDNYSVHSRTTHDDPPLEALVSTCSRVQIRATKMLRFGPEDIEPGRTDDARDRLSLEISHLKTLIEMLTEDGSIDRDFINAKIPLKIKKMLKYFQSSISDEDITIHSKLTSHDKNSKININKSRKLTEREKEILTILIEECAEVQENTIATLQANRGRLTTEQSKTSNDLLSLEIADLEAVVGMAIDFNLVDLKIANWRKLETIKSEFNF